MPASNLDNTPLLQHSIAPVIQTRLHFWRILRGAQHRVGRKESRGTAGLHAEARFRHPFLGARSPRARAHYPITAR